MTENDMLRLLVSSAIVTAALVSEPGPASARYASILMEADTGRVISSVNADTKNYPASLTKIMTLFMTFEALRDGEVTLSQKLRVSHRAQSRPPSRLGLRAGERISVRDAISAMVVKSANDVATVLAEALGGTERKFARKMTQRARQLGMRNTQFRNASGLPNRAQLSTARDMAILARQMLRIFPKRYGEFSRQTWRWRGKNYRNYNRLMQTYRGMDGIKTGYTRASGYNLVASAERNGRRLIAVVFGGRTSKTRNRIVARILDRGFTPKETMRAVASGRPRTALAASARKAAFTRKPPVPARSVDVASGTETRRSSRRPPALTPATGTVRGWTVQVGAFVRYTDARRMLNQAVRRVPSLAGQEFRIVSHKSKARRSNRIYKPRLIMASKSKAHDSCRVLKRRKIDCLVVWMGSKS